MSDLAPVRDDAPRRSPLLAPLAGVALLLLTLAAYSPVFEAGTIWDDDAYVTLNRNLWTTQGLIDTWTRPRSLPQYYPLVHTMYWLEYRLWGVAPLGYHVVNLLLHAGSCVLLWRLLLRLKVPGAWLAAAIFAVHPVQVESVAWITERKNTLSLLLYLGSATAALRWLSLPGPTAKLRWGWYAGALAMFIAALLSKTVTSTLPAALVVVMWWQGRRLDRQVIAGLAPFFIAGLALARVTKWMEVHHVGAWGRDWDFSFIERCLIAGRVIWFYLGKLAWPAELMFIYPRWRIDAGVWWQWLFPLAAAGLLMGTWLARERIGRGPAAAVMLYFGGLLPALGFFNVYPMRFSFVADHFVYLASVPAIAAAAAGLTLLARRGPRFAPALAVLLLAALAARTWAQSHWYHDAQTLWQRTLAQNPQATVAYYYLADMASGMNRHDEAIALMRQATEVSPGDPQPLSNLGLMLARAGRTDDAIAVLRQAASLYATPEPASMLTHERLAPLLIEREQWGEAAASCAHVLAVKPEAQGTRRMFVLALLRGGEAAGALEQAQELVRRGGQDAAVGDLELLAAALDRAGDPVQAVAVLDRAIAAAAREGRAIEPLQQRRQRYLQRLVNPDAPATQPSR
jgi:tetratricopeptide (TPR) repeat protein